MHVRICSVINIRFIDTYYMIILFIEIIGFSFAICALILTEISKSFLLFEAVQVLEIAVKSDWLTFSS